jgi:hypothetical protein
MDEYEQRVMHFLTANGVSFVVPQYELPYDKDIDSGGSKPDFVVLRPTVKECLVVEVTTTGSPKKLCEKLLIAEKQWLGALRKTLGERGVTAEEWRYRVLLFCRRDRIPYFRKRLQGTGTVIWPVEYTLEHWNWNAAVHTPAFDFCQTHDFCESLTIT